MLVKIVTLFLAGMAVLAMIGRLRWPGRRRPPPPAPRVSEAVRCPDCGTYRIGTGRCPCGKG